MTSLSEWENFYVIVGSSAGALIGLQFVVIALIADMPLTRSHAQAGGAFATPSVVHFGVVLLVSAIISAPWKEIGTVAFLWGLVGVCGMAYSIVVARRMRAQTVYQPVFEDWLFYLLLPFASYAGLFASAFEAHPHERPALFVLAGAALLLLFIGIHNAWDSVIYHVFLKKREQADGEKPNNSKE